MVREWHQQDDIISPFLGTRPAHVETLWIFDLDNDVLRYHKYNHFTRAALSLLREGPVAVSDFEPYTPRAGPMQSFPSLPWLLRRTMRRNGIRPECLSRRKAFIGRMLTDFAFQWRHLLCGEYNNSTFRKLASAIIRIITLDFNVDEVTTLSEQSDGPLVCIHSLPEWKSFNEDIVRAGGVSFVICRHPRHAIALMREDRRRSPVRHEDFRTYAVLSVRDFVIYRMDGDNERHTPAERFLDGSLPPSNAAIDQLLEATQIDGPKIALHKLPIELQDNILDNVSEGPIERAKVSCILDMGTPFTWKCGGRSIEREEGRTGRTPFSPVESHICFGKSISGLAYK